MRRILATIQVDILLRKKGKKSAIKSRVTMHRPNMKTGKLKFYKGKEVPIIEWRGE